MRTELSNMPDLQRELETLRARVSELVQITGVRVMPPYTHTSAFLVFFLQTFIKHIFCVRSQVFESIKSTLRF